MYVCMYMDLLLLLFVLLSKNSDVCYYYCYYYILLLFLVLSLVLQIITLQDSTRTLLSAANEWKMNIISIITYSLVCNIFNIFIITSISVIISTITYIATYHIETQTIRHGQLVYDPWRWIDLCMCVVCSPFDTVPKNYRYITYKP